MTVLRVAPVDSLETLRTEWPLLDVRSIFSTWEWVDTWWRHFGRDRRLLLHAGRTSDGALAVVLPLYLWRARPLAVVRFVGHPQGDELGPVGRAAPAAAAAALGQALSGIEHDLLLAEQLPGDEDWGRLLQGRRWRLESSPVLRFRGGWDDYLASRSSNFREQVRRRERRLHRRYAVDLRLCDEPGRLDRDLDVLFALHRRRFGEASGFAPERFHREIARQALEQGRLRLWLLRLDGVPAAAWYGFRVGNVESYYQAGRDGAFDGDSVGFVLLAHTVRAALEDGVDEYRFLRGPETYKRRFADVDPGLETVALPNTARGRAALAAGLAAKRWRDRRRP